jgi:AraC family transcriptional regulator, dual regulator of chb operon
MHGHDFAEVFWIREGNGLHQLNGKSLILNENDLVFIRPEDFHEVTVGSTEKCYFLNLALSWHEVQSLSHRYYGGDDSFWRGTHRIGKEQRSLLDRLVTGLESEGASRLLADHFLLTLLSLLPLQDFDRQIASCPDWLQKACKRLSNQILFSRGAGELARQAGKSPEHVARSLKKFTGMTPHQLVKHYRLQYARAMLRTTDQPILGIAMDCGFQSLSHFYRLFNEEVGLPPRAFRMGNRRTLPT